MPNVTAYQWISKPPSKPDKLYTTLSILAYLLERVTLKATFYGKMKTLLNRFPEIDIHASGFPKNWAYDPFWSKLYIPLTHRIRIVVFRSRNYLNRRKSVN